MRCPGAHRGLLLLPAGFAHRLVLGLAGAFGHLGLGLGFAVGDLCQLLGLPGAGEPSLGVGRCRRWVGGEMFWALLGEINNLC